MDLLKDPRNLQRTLGLAQQTQAAGGKVVKARLSHKLLGTAGVIGTAGITSKDFKDAVRTGVAALVMGVDDHIKQGQARAVALQHVSTGSVWMSQSARGTYALRDVGFTIFNEVGEYLAPTTARRTNTVSRAEMMEIIIYKIKETYLPHQVNVVTWDAALSLDVAKCCGLEECGTAKNEHGLEYRFAVFRGVGQIKWTGGIMRGGIPDVSCSGNYSLGNDSSIWFGNTDQIPHPIVSDLIELMTC